LVLCHFNPPNLEDRSQLSNIEKSKIKSLVEMLQ
jgi:hypothetical protein